MFSRKLYFFQELESTTKEEGTQSKLLSLGTILTWRTHKPLSDDYEDKFEPINSTKHPIIFCKIFMAITIEHVLLIQPVF